MRPLDPPQNETQTHQPGVGAELHAPTVTSAEGRPSPAAEPGDDGLLRRFGSFEILEVIGHGGMGVVYRARELPLGRIVALKQLEATASRNNSYRDRFLIEAKAIAALNHPHIVPIYHYGVENDQPYFTMKYLPNGTVAQNRSRYKGNARAVAALMIKVARAVHHAHMHQYKILHRDLKPHNIFLDESHEPLVGDFGLAKLLEGNEEITQTGSVLGTPAYMAPEQRLGRNKDLCFATDVYALGITLHELIVGRRPFDHAAEASTATGAGAHAAGTFREITLDPALNSIIQKCLRESPTERYVTASALADDLETWLAGGASAQSTSGMTHTTGDHESATAVCGPPQPTAAATVARLSRRSRTILYAGLAALLALFATALVLWGIQDRDGSELKTIRRTLAATGSVDLLAADGSLRWSDNIGRTVQVVRSEIQNGEPQLTVACDGRGLLEVLAGLPEKQAFRLEAEVRQDAALAAGDKYRVGLYVGRSRQDGASDCFICTQFREIRVDLQQRDTVQQEFVVAHLGPPWKAQLIEAQMHRNAEEWQPLSILVTPAIVSASLGNQTFMTKSKTDLLGQFAKLGIAQPEISGLTPGFRCSDGMGIFLDHCQATIRRIRIKRD